MSRIDEQLKVLRKEALRAYRDKEELNPDIVELIINSREIKDLRSTHADSKGIDK